MDAMGAIVLGLTIAIILSTIYLLLGQRPRNLPPCPTTPWPLVGNLPNLEENPREQFKAWHKKCGEIYSLYFGNSLVVVINGYKKIREVLVHKSATFIDRPPLFVDEIAGMSNKGVAFSSGDTWKENRTVTTQILKELGFGNQTVALRVQNEARCLVNQLLKSEGCITDIQAMVHVSVSNVICSVAVGRRFSHTDTRFLDILQSLERMSTVFRSAAVINFFPWLRHLPGDFFKIRIIVECQKRIQDLFTELCSFVEDDNNTTDRSDITIDAADTKHSSLPPESDSETVCKLPPLLPTERESKKDEKEVFVYDKSFVKSYRIKRKEKLGFGESIKMNEQHMIKTVIDLFAGGTESSAATICWCILYTLTTPGVQERLHAELDARIGCERMPQIADRARLPYLDAVIKETQRFASIIPFSLLRMATEDVELDGYTIPRGTSILLNLDTVLHDPEIWGHDTNTFNPDRFLCSDGSVCHKEEFIPFSLGKRSCLGQGLAQTELFIFLASLFQRFEFQLPDPSNPPSLKEIFGLNAVPQPYQVRYFDRYNSLTKQKNMENNVI